MVETISLETENANQKRRFGILIGVGLIKLTSAFQQKIPSQSRSHNKTIINP